MTQTLGEWVETSHHDVGPFFYNDGPLTPDKRALKLRSLADAAAAHDRPCARMLAMSREGLVSDDFRKRLWPLLLDAPQSPLHSSLMHSLPPHPEETQVRLDCDRSFVYFPTGIDNPTLKRLQNQLYELIVTVLRRNPELSYYQGFHDVAQIFLLVFGPAEAAPILEYVALYFLRDFMMPEMEASLPYMGLVTAVINAVDPEFALLFPDYAIFNIAISAMLTIFAHDLRVYTDICILFDFVFAYRNMAIPPYLYAAFLLLNKDKFSSAQDMDPSEAIPIVSELLKTFPANDSALFQVTSYAETLFQKYPPQTLQPWKKLSQYSVLKTTAAPLPDTQDAILPTQLNDHDTDNDDDNDNQRWTQNSFFPLVSSPNPPNTLSSGGDSPASANGSQHSDASLFDSMPVITSAVDSFSAESLSDLPLPFSHPVYSLEEVEEIARNQVAEDLALKAEREKEAKRKLEKKRAKQLSSSGTNNPATGWRKSLHKIPIWTETTTLVARLFTNRSHVVDPRIISSVFYPRSALSISFYGGILSLLLAWYIHKHPHTLPRSFETMREYWRYIWNTLVARYF